MSAPELGPWPDLKEGPPLSVVFLQMHEVLLDWPQRGPTLSETSLGDRIHLPATRELSAPSAPAIPLDGLV